MSMQSESPKQAGDRLSKIQPRRETRRLNNQIHNQHPRLGAYTQSLSPTLTIRCAEQTTLRSRRWKDQNEGVGLKGRRVSFKALVAGCGEAVRASEHLRLMDVTLPNNSCQIRRVRAESPSIAVCAVSMAPRQYPSARAHCKTCRIYLVHVAPRKRLAFNVGCPIVSVPASAHYLRFETSLSEPCWIPRERYLAGTAGVHMAEFEEVECATWLLETQDFLPVTRHPKVDAPDNLPSRKQARHAPPTRSINGRH